MRERQTLEMMGITRRNSKGTNMAKTHQQSFGIMAVLVASLGMAGCGSTSAFVAGGDDGGLRDGTVDGRGSVFGDGSPSDDSPLGDDGARSGDGGGVASDGGSASPDGAGTMPE